MISRSHFNKGFTLLELLVVVAIVIIMTAVILSNFPSIRSKIELDLIAQEVAITIRQAQAFSTSSRGSAGEQELIGSHGIYISAATPSSFVLFSDKDNDDEYDEGTTGCGQSDSECKERFDFRGGISIKQVICYTSDGERYPSQNMVVLFERPNPEAEFVLDTHTEACGRINVIIGKTAPGAANERQVTVWQSGHIYAGKRT